MTSTRGRLLLATPPLVDSNFDRSVIFVLEHNTEGAVGVILNRPSDDELAEPLDRWTDLASPPAVVYLGGPVDPDAFIALGELTPAAADAAPTPGESGRSTALDDELGDDDPPYIAISGLIGSVDLSGDPAIAAGDLRSVRVFRGYAGWGPGQLDGEIDAGAWMVLDALPEDIADSNPAELWRTALRRQPGRLAWLADAPDDLSVN